MVALEFPLSGTLSERFIKLKSTVELMIPFLESPAPVDPLLFACESALISGEDTDRIPWPRVQKKYKELKEGEPSWVAEFKVNDVLVAESCIKSRGPRGDIPDPIIINMPLCRDKLAPRWRNSTYLGTRTGYPAPKYAKYLVEKWRMVVLRGAKRLKEESVLERQIFSWMMHDAFVCIQPFKDGNERTARYLLQLVRRELDLEPVFISKDDMTYHRERVRMFRQYLFIPIMERYGFIDRM